MPFTRESSLLASLRAFADYAYAFLIAILAARAAPTVEITGEAGTRFSEPNLCGSILSVARFWFRLKFGFAGGQTAAGAVNTGTFNLPHSPRVSDDAGKAREIFSWPHPSQSLTSLS